MILEALILAAGGLGAGAVATARLRGRRHERHQAARRAADELAAVRSLAEEDAVLLGEELVRLDARLGQRELDDDARRDYRTALEAYERALEAVDRIETVDDVTRVTDALVSGRYAVACVDARVEGTPLPARRTPCFFNPQHGVAVTDVLWTPPGRGSREVPACAQDAARHAAGQDPEVRCVTVDGRRVPYYEVGGLLQPYARGYFPTATDARRDARAQLAMWDQHKGDTWSGGGYTQL